VRFKDRDRRFGRLHEGLGLDLQADIRGIAEPVNDCVEAPVEDGQEHVQRSAGLRDEVGPDQELAAWPIDCSDPAGHAVAIRSRV
jgi:hypothetical protein